MYGSTFFRPRQHNQAACGAESEADRPLKMDILVIPSVPPTYFETLPVNLCYPAQRHCRSSTLRRRILKSVRAMRNASRRTTS